MADARNRLEILNRQREAIEKSPADSVQIESYNTPLGHTVVGREVHFQLKNGRIAYVPLNELVDRAVDDIKHKAYNFPSIRELSDTVGPIEGFRMTYMIRLRPPTTDEIHESNSQRPKIEDRFVLRPVSDDLGETIDEALQPNSQFHQVITGRRAQRRHDHALDLSRQFRRLPPVEKGTLSARLPRRRPSFARRRSDQRLSQGSKSTAE